MHLKGKSNFNKQKLIGDSFLILMMLGVIIYRIKLLAASSMDSDTFFLIATGEYIVKHGVVPTINPFVIHSGFEMIVQQWLFDVIMYLLYDTFGLWGIYLYSVIMLLITMFVIYKFVGMYTENIDVRMFCVALYGITWGMFLVARPTSISFLLCLLLIMTIEQYRRKNNPMILLWLLPISIFTVNVHSAMWPMLFVLMLPYLAPNALIEFLWSLASDKLGTTKQRRYEDYKELVDAIKVWFNDKKWLLLAIVVMIALGFVNPNGIRGMLYVILSYEEASSGLTIMELTPPQLTSTQGIIAIAAIVLFVLYVLRFKSNSNVQLLYMAMGTIVLAFAHLRNSWFLCFSVLPMIAILLTDVLSRSIPNATKKQTVSKLPIAIAVIAIAISVVLITPDHIEDTQFSPVKAVEYLSERDADEVVLYTDFNNGAYMEFNGYKVYIDARPELFQIKINGKEDVYTEYADVRNGNCDIGAFIDKYGFTYMVVEDRTFLAGYMEMNQDFNMVVDGEGYKLYERKPTT